MQVEHRASSSSCLPVTADFAVGSHLVLHVLAGPGLDSGGGEQRLEDGGEG